MPPRPVVTYPARVLELPSAPVGEITASERGTTPDGQRRLVEDHGVEARAFVHELDHLDGYLILDRVASARTDVFPRRRYARAGEDLR